MEYTVPRPTVRAALPGDIAAMLSLFPQESAADREKTAEALELLMEQSSGSSTVFVAIQEGNVVGLCSTRTETSTVEGGPEGIVENFVLHQDFSREDIGQSLLGYVMNWFSEQGITRMHLSSGRNKACALQFYLSQGWTDAGSICLRNGF